MNSIAFVISGLEKGGAETQLYRLIVALQKKGIVCSVFALRGGYYAELFKKMGVPVHVAHLSLGRVLSSMRQLRQWVKSHDADLVHSWLPHANIFSKIALITVPKIPLIVSIRVKEKKYWMQTLMERLLDFRSTKILVNHKSIAQHLKSYFFSKKKIFYIGNILEVTTPDTKNVKRIKEEYKDPIVLTVGHFRPQKNYLRNLKVLKQLHKNHAFQAIFIGGEGSDAQKVQEYIAKNNMSFVHVLPSHSPVADYMKAADVFFLPSLYEGHSNVLLEASALGCSIVTSDIPENKWLKGGARFCKPRDVEHMVLALEAALESPPHAGNLKKIQMFIKSQHDAQNITKAYISCYNEVLTHVRH